jgi:hypothetical protein
MRKTEWVPSDKQKRDAERYIFPLVILVRVLTSWYSAAIWGTLLPLCFGYSIGTSLVFGVFTALLARFVWKDDTISSMRKGYEDGEDSNSRDRS